jgi:transcriptional regulator of aromatic amino acid metabolism
MNPDQGVIYVVLKHFTRHLHPRAVEIEKELDAGRRLSDAEVDHVAQVLEEVRLLRPLIERHPEYRDLADRVIALYASIARRARQNEISQGPGTTTGTALRQ